MQQTQQREGGERISWARALVFAFGFFLIAAILVGELPSYINSEITASSLEGFEQTMLALAYICIGGFLVIQVIVLLFDPKPVLPPIIFAVLGFIIGVVGLGVMYWASLTGNQTLPIAGTTPWHSVLGGVFLWFPPNAFDLVALGAIMLFVGVAWFFYSILAIREQTHTDRRDPGTTGGIRALITVGTVMLVVFMILFAFISTDGLAKATGISISVINTASCTFLGIAIFCTIGAFALRLHYLMRPTRKTTMNGLYMVGVNLLPIGVICIVAWVVIYPFMAWFQAIPAFGPFFILCARKSAIPLSCSFSQEGGDLIGAIVTTSGFGALAAAIWAWRTKRNLVIIGSVTVIALLALTTLLTHIEFDAGDPYQPLFALLFCGAALIAATIWTSTARREFAVVGEKPLGCLGMWLLVGTCLFLYIGAFALYSLPGFHDIESNFNIPFVPGASVGTGGATALDAVIVVVIMSILAGIQFYFLVRNRYRV